MLKRAAGAARQAPIVRLAPKSSFEIVLRHTTEVAIILMGVVAAVFALWSAQFVLVPVSLGIVVGLMLGPVATRVEAWGVHPGISATITVLVFIVGLVLFAAAIAAPLSYWIGRLPQIWNDIRIQLSDLRGPLESLRGLRDQIREMTGAEGIAVSIDEGFMDVGNMATLAPAVAGQVLLFFASLYFFVATRHQTRIAILKLCFGRRLRWRVAHMFRDIEQLVSRYLLSITAINIAEGAAVGLGLWLAGVPSAAMWGALAMLTNFVVFVGPAVMAAVLLVVGMSEYETLGGSLMPVAIYLAINVMEAQFVTPYVIGRTMTLNPFIVLLSLVFWLWLWGPVGGFIAVPALLIGFAVLKAVIPQDAFTGNRSRGATTDVPTPLSGSG